MKLWWFTFSIFLMFCAVSRAATLVPPGPLNTATWTSNGNPYIISGDVIVIPTASLTIEHGTDIQFSSTDSFSYGLDTNKPELIVQGALYVQGTSNAPVIFHAISNFTAGAWYG
ncbi:MAG TPA: hypothetical protein VGE41_09835, partial [Verrucomicrobiae bacterium]